MTLSLIFAAFAAFPVMLVSAQTASPTINLFIPYATTSSGVTMLASVVAVNDPLTTYAIGCAPDTPSDMCEWGNGVVFDYTVGPSTVELLLTEADTITQSLSFNCQVDTQASTAQCTQTYSALEVGPADGSDTSSTTSLLTGTMTGEIEPTDYQAAILAVEITAGAEKLSGGSGAATQTTPSLTSSSAVNTGSSSVTTSSTTKQTNAAVSNAVGAVGLGVAALIAAL
jgi:hypothetical protein